jgi:hypothetical protein
VTVSRDRDYNCVYGRVTESVTVTVTSVTVTWTVTGIMVVTVTVMVTVTGTVTVTWTAAVTVTAAICMHQLITKKGHLIILNMYTQSSMYIYTYEHYFLTVTLSIKPLCSLDRYIVP